MHNNYFFLFWSICGHRNLFLESLLATFIKFFVRFICGSAPRSTTNFKTHCIINLQLIENRYLLYIYNETLVLLKNALQQTKLFTTDNLWHSYCAPQFRMEIVKFFLLTTHVENFLTYDTCLKMWRFRELTT